MEGDVDPARFVDRNTSLPKVDTQETCIQRQVENKSNNRHMLIFCHVADISHSNSWRRAHETVYQIILL